MSNPAISEFLADLDARFPPEGSIRQEVVSYAPPITTGSPHPPGTTAALPAPQPPPASLVCPPPVVDTARPAYEQQPGEPNEAYSRFLSYARMGARGPDNLPRPRSLAALATKIGLAENTVYGLSSRWRWRERVREWDAAQTAPDLQAEQLDLGRRVLRVVDQGLSDLEQRIADGAAPVDGIKELAYLAQVGTQMSRLAAGLSSENVSSHVHVHGHPNAAKASLSTAYEATVRGRPLARSFLRRFLAALASAALPETDPEFEHANALLRVVPYAHDGSSAQRVEHLAGLLRRFPFERRGQQDALIKAAEYLSAHTRTNTAARTA